jgi:hypothetical protein
MRYMDINKYRIAYASQKANAARRGIEFLLTFQEWCEFWGEDIEKRGVGPNDLQMQRYADTGPYALGNIKKGTPKENAITRGNMLRKANCEKNHEELQAELDALMNDPSNPDFDSEEESYCYLGIVSSNKSRYRFRS